jgi:hypothetical protein
VAQVAPKIFYDWHMYFMVNVNTRRGAIKGNPDEVFRRTEARRHVRLMLAPSDAGQVIWDSMIPDYLVTDGMVDRFLAIDPPEFRVLSAFDPVIEDIERSYVLGLLFSALSASVVTIERTLNEARMRLHEHITPKIKELWGKKALNEWEGNIAALEQWGYLPDGLPGELRALFDVRCQYLHSGELANLAGDTLRAVNGAYALLRALIGFPPSLFEYGAAISCRNEQDPLFKVFYAERLSPQPFPTPAVPPRKEHRR